jgi:hypothetical protein
MNVTDYKGVMRDRSASFFRHKRGEPATGSRFKAKNATLFKDFHEKKSDDCENPSMSLLDDDIERNAFDKVRFTLLFTG